MNTGPSNDNYSSYMSAKNEKESESNKQVPNRRQISPYQRNYSPGRKKNVEIKRQINNISASQKGGILKSNR